MWYLYIKNMSKRIKWALLALLGFSTACSTVKNTAKESKTDAPEEVVPTPEEHRIRVLYGVRPPKVQQTEAETPAQTPEAE